MFAVPTEDIRRAFELKIEQTKDDSFADELAALLADVMRQQVQVEAKR